MVFLGLGIGAWITILTLVALIALLSFTKLPPHTVFLGAVAVLFLTGVLDEEELLAGFGSEAVLVEAVLFVIVAAMVSTGAVQFLAKRLIDSKKSYRVTLSRMMGWVAGFSAFISSSPIVALFVDVARAVSRKLGINPSKLLLPISYIAMLGGACTVIGTSSNLIIANFYKDATGQEMNFFAPTVPALFCLGIGIGLLILMRNRIADRKSPEDALANISDFTVELLVPTDNMHVGSTIEEAGLMDAPGGHLIRIIRFDKEVISPVEPDEFVFGGDRLVYSGEIQEILELKESHQFVVAPEHVFSSSEIEKGRKLRTALVPPFSKLIGKTIVESDFEKKTGITLVAVARNGERINQSPREISILPSDVLLLECPKKFSPDENMLRLLQFFDNEELVNVGPKTVLSSAIVIAMVVLSATGVMTLLQACFLAAMAMLLTKCLSAEKVTSCVDWNVLMMFVGSVCIGTAIMHTGLADAGARLIARLSQGNPHLALICICTGATLVGEFVDDNAVAALFAPIALTSATALGVNPLTFCVSLMIACCSSFAIPSSSNTHLLVFGPGGFRIGDFLKIGIPMDIIILIANIAISLLVYPLFN